MKKIISIFVIIMSIFAVGCNNSDKFLYNSSNSTMQIPDDAVTFNGSKYKIYNLGGSWQDAKEYCESLGGHLATITSREENIFLYDYMRSQNYTSSYFGLEKINDNWTWVTGEEFNYECWAEGEPSNGYGVENYGMFYKLYTYTWNDGGPTTDADYGASSDECTFLCEWEL